MTIDEIIKKNEEAGHTFFSRENMRWFRSRVHSKVYEGRGGIFFVTSEQRRSFSNQGSHNRFYSVRRAMPSGDIKVNGMHFRTSDRAHSTARRLSKMDVVYPHDIDIWTQIQGGEILQKVLETNKIQVRRCPRTDDYMMPAWVYQAISAYKDNFAGMTEVEYLRKMAI